MWLLQANLGRFASPRSSQRSQKQFIRVRLVLWIKLRTQLRAKNSAKFLICLQISSHPNSLSKFSFKFKTPMESFGKTLMLLEFKSFWFAEFFDSYSSKSFWFKSFESKLWRSRVARLKMFKNWSFKFFKFYNEAILLLVKHPLKVSTVLILHFRASYRSLPIELIIL